MSDVLPSVCVCLSMQSFAENTMNELLGWYGYDKVELRDGESGEGVDHPQHVSVLKGVYRSSNTCSHGNALGCLSGNYSLTPGRQIKRSMVRFRRSSTLFS